MTTVILPGEYDKQSPISAPDERLYVDFPNERGVATHSDDGVACSADIRDNVLGSVYHPGLASNQVDLNAALVRYTDPHVTTLGIGSVSADFVAYAAMTRT